MSDGTSIEWSQASWNPVLGCDRVSDGCTGCYAIPQARMRAANPNPKVAAAFAGLTERTPERLDWTGQVNQLPARLNQPLSWRKPRRIFVNSLSDMFHAKIEADFIAQVFAVMSLADQHVFQMLTKRHGRMRSLLNEPDFVAVVDDHRERIRPGCGDFVWPLPNLHLGVSVEDQHWADVRIPALLRTPAAVRWISAEPLLGPIILADEWIGADPYRRDEPALSWMVVGGESGPGARPMHPAWARDIRDQCVAAGVPYFFKQQGAWAPRGRLRDGLPLPVDNARTLILNVDGATRGRAAGSISNSVCEFSDGSHCEVMEHVGKKAAGRELDGRLWSEYPQPAEVSR